MHPEQSFSIKTDIVPYFFNEWHFHPELELVYIEKGTGTQFIGDNIQQFKHDEMVLVGANLPHLWRCDEKYFKKNATLKAKSIVIHFRMDMFGESFFNLPENKKISQLLDTARLGLRINNDTKIQVVSFMKKMQQAKNAERIILLLQILNCIASAAGNTIIAANDFKLLIPKKETERINEIYQYVFKNFRKIIRLQDVAALLNMNTHSFCRYFKTRTKKSFFRFLLEVRVNHACKLLSETEYSVSEICYKSGFNNFSNFNRYFKQIAGTTPLKYKRNLFNE